MSQKEASATPMLRQYQEIKDQYRDCILFYRIGDFYEMFYDDAVTASKVLDIVLTSRNKNDPNPVPLCGIPHHSYQPYLEKLVEKGHKVAICDQVEDPALAKGIVKREVIRVVTPGLAEDRSLVAVARGPKNWGIASLEIGTGNFRVTEVPSERGLEELRSLNPSEVVLSESRTDEDAELQPLLITRLPDWLWDESTARKILQDQFGVATLSGFNCETLHEGVIAAGAVLHYVKETQKVGRLPHLTSLKRYERSEGMLLNEETRKNLSLTELIDLIDHTKTSLGKRTLRSWMESPLIQKGAIEERLDAVEELQRHPVVLERLQKLLGSIYDLEKIASRLSLGTANARDLRAIADSLAKMEELRPLLEELGSSKLKEIRTGWDSLPSLLEEIEKTIVEEPPLTLREGGLIKEGVQEGLDELRTLQKDAKGAIAAMEERERERTGISSLKIRYNQVFGYYLEVTAAHLSKVPLDFTRKQTLTNAERYITPELKEFEGKILGAEEKIRALEFQIFNECRERALAAVPQIQRQADRVGQLDAWASLATYARQSGAVRPRIDESRLLKIRGGRHPVVEKCLPVGSFVPNDLLIDGEGDRLLMVTGPNMAGKSTIIRQAGLLVLMAQAGSFVPAVEATIGIVDQIFTRVGASDRLARGESTFMVEMCETAAILHNATDRSLILLDEIGRGTSTFDGISIAWAVAEHLHDAIRARTLFATHYHELLDLALTRPGIKNVNVQVEDEKGDVVFLYRLVPGGMSKSFGLHVAKLAGLPHEVLERAQQVLENLEKKNAPQTSLF